MFYNQEGRHDLRKRIAVLAALIGVLLVGVNEAQTKAPSGTFEYTFIETVEAPMPDEFGGPNAEGYKLVTIIFVQDGACRLEPSPCWRSYFVR